MADVVSQQTKDDSTFVHQSSKPVEISFIQNVRRLRQVVKMSFISNVHQQRWLWHRCQRHCQLGSSVGQLVECQPSG